MRPTLLGLSVAMLAAAGALAQPAPSPAPQRPETVQPIRRGQSEMPDVLAACDRAAAADLPFADEDAFAARLTTALEARPARLTIDVPRPFSPETIPDRLHGWLVETARAGGTVTRRDVPCGRANGQTRAVTFGVRAFFARPGMAVNAAVRGYDAVLWAEQATGAVNQVQFVRRDGA